MTIELAHDKPAGDVVYPLRLLIAPEGRRITVWESLLCEVEAIAALLEAGGDPEQVLLELLAPRMAVEGYLPLPRAMAPILIWQSRDPPVCPMLSSVIPLAAASDCGWALTHSRADLPRGVSDVWVVVEEGKVVAAAWLCEREIAVETAPTYRRRGFARAVAAALIRACSADGRAVVYRCLAANAASAALAESLGLFPTAREYRPGFRRT